MQGLHEIGTVVVQPRRLSGTVFVPASKSELIRSVFCSVTTDADISEDNGERSDDIAAAFRCRDALRNKSCIYDCGESAAVLRFAVPIALALCGGGSFICRGSLSSRPLEPYLHLFESCGIRWRIENGTLTVEGELPKGELHISGALSSQFVSGLLMALPYSGGGKLIVDDRFCSPGYVDMTVRIMREAGIYITKENNSYTVTGQYRPFSFKPNGDWSQAAFWYASRFLGADIQIGGLHEGSSQPDERINELFERFGTGGALTLDMGDTPDLLPPLALMAALRNGECCFTGCERLKYKESDRLKSVTAVLSALGADIVNDGGALYVRGVSKMHGGRVYGFNDHRIVMMAAVAATACDGAVIIDGADSIKKSYPDFFDEYNRLGGGGCVGVLREKTEY